MFRLFVSKLPKSVSAEEVEVFLRQLFPEATHVQLLRGSHNGEHKGHAYVHFADEAVLLDALQRAENKSLPAFHGALINVKRASCVGAPEANSVAPQPLPPQLACYSCTKCACVSSTLVEGLENVIARCDLPGGVTVVAFGTEEERTAALALCRGGAEKCLPPVLPQLLSRCSRKRRRRGLEADGSDDSDEREKWEEKEEVRDAAGGVAVVESLVRKGFVPLTPAAVLVHLRDFMEGCGKVAVKDQKGHMAVLNLPAHAMSLE